MNKVSVFLGITQVIVALGAIPAGISMILDPSGGSMGMTSEILSESPFTNFFIPGLLLFIVNGLGNGLGAFYTFKNYKSAGLLGIALGLFLVLWISIQVYMIGLTHLLQPLFCVIGLIELRLGFILNRKVS